MKARTEMAAKVRRAAEDVLSGREIYSCNALNMRNCNHCLWDKYGEFFRPEGMQNYYAYWLDVARARGHIDEREMRDWRVTALCLLAAMIESGDLDDVIKARR